MVLAERLTALSSSPAQLESTLANLEMWAQKLRDVALGEVGVERLHDHFSSRGARIAKSAEQT